LLRPSQAVRDSVLGCWLRATGKQFVREALTRRRWL
jgi:hypothetical protein